MFCCDRFVIVRYGGCFDLFVGRCVLVAVLCYFVVLVFVYLRSVGLLLGYLIICVCFVICLIDYLVYACGLNVVFRLVV